MEDRRIDQIYKQQQTDRARVFPASVNVVNDARMGEVPSSVVEVHAVDYAVTLVSMIRRCQT